MLQLGLLLVNEERTEQQPEEKQAKKVKREGARKEVKVEREKLGGGGRGKDVEQGEVQQQEKEVKEVLMMAMNVQQE